MGYIARFAWLCSLGVGRTALCLPCVGGGGFAEAKSEGLSLILHRAATSSTFGGLHPTPSDFIAKRFHPPLVDSPRPCRMGCPSSFIAQRLHLPLADFIRLRRTSSRSDFIRLRQTSPDPVGFHPARSASISIARERISSLLRQTYREQLYCSISTRSRPHRAATSSTFGGFHHEVISSAHGRFHPPLSDLTAP